MQPVFTEVRNAGLEGCSFREKGAVSQRFKGIYKILEHYFLSGHFHNVSVVVFDPVLGCGLHSCNYIKRKLHYIHFSDNSPKFSS